jgi:hypothetical protein
MLSDGETELNQLAAWALENIHESPTREQKITNFARLPVSVEDEYVKCIHDPKKSRSTNLLCGNTLLVLTMLLAERLESA